MELELGRQSDETAVASDNPELPNASKEIQKSTVVRRVLQAFWELEVFRWCCSNSGLKLRSKFSRGIDWYRYCAEASFNANV